MMKNYNFITNRLAVGDMTSRIIDGWAAVVTVCTKNELRGCGYDVELKVPTLCIEFDDGYSSNYKENLDRILEFIAEHIKNGCVLIHCAAGISRSASIAIAYLCRYAGMSLDEAQRHVWRARRIISPAPYFLKMITEHYNLEELYRNGPRELV